MKQEKMIRKAIIWKVKLVGVEEDLHVMTAGSSFCDLGDISGLLTQAGQAAGISSEVEIESIKKSCVALGFTKLPDDGVLTLRKEGTIIANDAARLTPTSFHEGTDQTVLKQAAAIDHEKEIMLAIKRTPIYS